MNPMMIYFLLAQLLSPSLPDRQLTKNLQSAVESLIIRLEY